VGRGELGPGLELLNRGADFRTSCIRSTITMRKFRPCRAFPILCAQKKVEQKSPEISAVIKPQQTFQPRPTDDWRMHRT
jgi:hypothetical protein